MDMQPKMTAATWKYNPKSIPVDDKKLIAWS